MISWSAQRWSSPQRVAEGARAVGRNDLLDGLKELFSHLGKYVSIYHDMSRASCVSCEECISQEDLGSRVSVTSSRLFYPDRRPINSADEQPRHQIIPPRYTTMGKKRKASGAAAESVEVLWAKYGKERKRRPEPGLESVRPEKKVQCLLDNVLVGEVMQPLIPDLSVGDGRAHGHASSRDHGILQEGVTRRSRTALPGKQANKQRPNTKL